jgi:predicted RNA-binding Zn-ribbon protein involved in translation (DUF1610 family)
LLTHQRKSSERIRVLGGTPTQDAGELPLDRSCSYHMLLQLLQFFQDTREPSPRLIDYCFESKAGNRRCRAQKGICRYNHILTGRRLFLRIYTFCLSCGKQLPGPGLVFCPYCGNNLKTRLQSTRPQPLREGTQRTQKPSFLDRFLALVFIAVGLLLLVIGLAGYVYISNYASSTQSCLNHLLCSVSSGGTSYLESQLSEAETLEVTCAILAVVGAPMLGWALYRYSS